MHRERPGHLGVRLFFFLFFSSLSLLFIFIGFVKEEAVMVTETEVIEISILHLN